MPRRLNRLLRFTLRATDGPIGRVHDLYFDDHRWTVRYVVADTRRWLPGRRVLISPISVDDIDWRRRRLHVDLSRERIRSSPDIDTDKPVSRQHEADFHDYFCFPYYWDGEDLWGWASLPASLRIPAQVERGEEKEKSPNRTGDPNLRSAHYVIGHRIQASDAEIGHVEDFLFDESSWQIRYVVVDTRNWWPGKRVLVSPAWISWVSWLQLNVHVDLPSETIRNAPPYDPRRPFTVEDDVRLLRYYGSGALRDLTAQRAS